MRLREKLEAFQNPQASISFSSVLIIYSTGVRSLILVF